MYYSNGFPTTYEELITFYPVFYRNVLEMEAILQAEGKIIDEGIQTINRVIENCFVESADEAMITRLEAWLDLETDKSRPLEERRRLLYAFFVGFGKLSASKIKEAVRAFTGADSVVSFNPSDDAGNNTLFIEMARGKNAELSYSDIETVLSRKIPAHIAYKAFITYTVAIGVGQRHSNFNYEHRLSGLEPDIALLGKKQLKTSVTETDAAAQTYGTDFRYCGTALAGNI